MLKGTGKALVQNLKLEEITQKVYWLPISGCWQHTQAIIHRSYTLAGHILWVICNLS